LRQSLFLSARANGGEAPSTSGRGGGNGYQNGSAASTIILPGGRYSPTSTPLASPPPPDSDVLIELDAVHKAFGAKPILAGATIAVRRGEAVGIIGASGTGKSTTLRLMAGLLAPDAGCVRVCGTPRSGLLADDPALARKVRVGMVFQNGALFDSLTVGENVGFTLLEHSATASPSAIRAAVAAALSAVGLSGVERLYPSELSGGMRKRVALARAIITDPTGDGRWSSGGGTRGGHDGGEGVDADAPPPERVIMYDEPTAGLDPVASTVIEDLIRSLHTPPGGSGASSLAAGGSANGEGVAPGGGVSSYIVVTHQHSTIRRAVDRLVFLHGGAVVWQGSVAEFDSTDEPIVRQFASGSLDGPIRYE
jgi:ABC-type transporter Mla maintaining outer membrane lipid asymmetry ATPase subunit MlaF